MRKKPKLKTSRATATPPAGRIFARPLNIPVLQAQTFEPALSGASAFNDYLPRDPVLFRFVLSQLAPVGELPDTQRDALLLDLALIYAWLCRQAEADHLALPQAPEADWTRGFIAQVEAGGWSAVNETLACLRQTEPVLMDWLYRRIRRMPPDAATIWNATVGMFYLFLFMVGSGKRRLA